MIYYHPTKNGMVVDQELGRIFFLLSAQKYNPTIGMGKLKNFIDNSNFIYWSEIIADVISLEFVWRDQSPWLSLLK